MRTVTGYLWRFLAQLRGGIPAGGQTWQRLWTTGVPRGERGQPQMAESDAAPQACRREGMWTIPHSPLRVRRRPAFLKPSSGFSLVEIVISIAILSVGLFGAIRVFPMGLRASRRAGLTSQASLLAGRTMVMTKLQAWEDLTEGETTTTEEPYEVTVSVDVPLIDGLVDPTRLKRVSVTVTWTQQERERSYSIVSYVHRLSP